MTFLILNLTLRCYCRTWLPSIFSSSYCRIFFESFNSLLRCFSSLDLISVLPLYFVSLLFSATSILFWKTSILTLILFTSPFNHPIRRFFQLIFNLNFFLFIFSFKQYVHISRYCCCGCSCEFLS